MFLSGLPEYVYNVRFRVFKAKLRRVDPQEDKPESLHTGVAL